MAAGRAGRRPATSQKNTSAAGRDRWVAGHDRVSLCARLPSQRQLLARRHGHALDRAFDPPLQATTNEEDKRRGVAPVARPWLAGMTFDRAFYTLSTE